MYADARPRRRCGTARRLRLGRLITAAAAASIKADEVGGFLANIDAIVPIVAIDLFDMAKLRFDTRPVSALLAGAEEEHDQDHSISCRHNGLE